MNIRLSIASVRTANKSGYVIEKNGTTIKQYVGKTLSSNIKEDILLVLEKALRAVKPLVQHEDILYIEIQNVHLQQWLSGLKDYKEYSKSLDKVFDTLEGIDCRYRFVFQREPYAKQVVMKTKVDSTIKGSSLAEAILDIENGKDEVVNEEN